MSTLLIRNIAQLVTCDDGDRILQGADLYCEDGFIKTIGRDLDVEADRVIDGSHMFCYPGLVNTHHHLYQVFSRNLPQVQNMELFDWLRTLYEIWKNLDADVIRLSSLTGMGELMKHGCTTCFDHHYVFPAHSGDLLGAQLSAARELGIRREEVVFAMDAMADPVSLYEPLYDSGGDALRVMDQIGDENSSDSCWLQQLALKDAISRLTPRQREILALRYSEGKTQMEVSSEIGISQAQVSRLEKTALGSIRKIM